MKIINMKGNFNVSSSIGEISAATLIAEIENFKDFSSGDRLASWLGIVPNVYQSADKYHNGRITKRGSKVAR
jgi:transposase